MQLTYPTYSKLGHNLWIYIIVNDEFVTTNLIFSRTFPHLCADDLRKKKTGIGIITDLKKLHIMKQLIAWQQNFVNVLPFWHSLYLYSLSDFLLENYCKIKSSIQIGIDKILFPNCFWDAFLSMFCDWLKCLALNWRLKGKVVWPRMFLYVPLRMQLTDSNWEQNLLIYNTK